MVKVVRSIAGCLGDVGVEGGKFNGTEHRRTRMDNTSRFSLSPGGSCYARGLKPEQGAEPLHFIHCVLGVPLLPLYV